MATLPKPSQVKPTLGSYLEAIAGEADRFAVIDCEMSGLDVETQHLIEVAIVQLDLRGDLIDVWESLICSPDGSAGDKQTQQVHHISDAMLADAPAFSEIAGDIAQRLDGACLVGYSVWFDINFLRAAPGREYDFMPGRPVDVAWPCQESFELACARRNIAIQNRHTALGDAAGTAVLFLQVLDYWVMGGDRFQPCTMTTCAEPNQQDLWKPRGGYDPASDLAAGKRQAEAHLHQRQRQSQRQPL